MAEGKHQPSGNAMTVAEAELRSKAWESVIHSYGTFAVFLKRVEKLKLKRRLRDFFGIALPCVLGFFYANNIGGYQKLLIYFIGLIALAQLLVTIWSLVSGWDEDYSYAMNAARENEGMSQAWERVATSAVELLRTEFASTRNQDDKIQERDRAQNISEKERRFGMRRALFFRRKECAVCHVVPVNLKPTECVCCGSF